MASYCDYFKSDQLQQAYHDNEWGTPCHDDNQLFEHLSMEVLQCGLSWQLCLRRRDVFRACFDNFRIDAVARFTDDDVRRILDTEGMIRSERKVRAIIQNARVAQRLGSLDRYFWQFTDGKSIVYHGHPESHIPTQNGLSQRIAADLRRQGMTFVGPVNIYAFLQSCGIVNDHSANCPAFARITANHPSVTLPPDNEQP